MGGKIFVNYRRADDPGSADRLMDRLSGAFSSEDLFMDVLGLKAGDEWEEVLRRKVAETDIMLVVIGPRWESILREQARGATDYVVYEISEAIKRGKIVIPVLVNGAKLPSPATLPATIASLPDRQSKELNRERFDADCEELFGSLIEKLKRIEDERRRIEEERRQVTAETGKAPTNWAVVISTPQDGVDSLMDIQTALMAARREYIPGRVLLDFGLPANRAAEGVWDTRDIVKGTSSATIRGAQVRLATASWGGSEGKGGGILRLLGDLATTGMGVRYFSDVGASGNSLLERVLHGLLTPAVWLLAFAFVPLVLCTFIFGFNALLGYYVFRNETFYVQIHAMVLTSFLTIYFLVSLAHKRLGHIRDERTLALPILNMLLLYGLLLGAIILIDHPRAFGNVANLKIAEKMRLAMEVYGIQSGNVNWLERIRLLDETGVYIGFMQLLQYAAGYAVSSVTMCVLVVLVVAYVLPFATTSEQRRGMLLASVGVVTMWLLLLFVLWPENLATATVLNLFLLRPQNAAHQFQPIWTLDGDPSWPPISLILVDVRSVDGLREYMPLNWFDVLFVIFLLCLLLLAVVLVRRRIVWSRWHRSAGLETIGQFRPPLTDQVSWAPRLILSRGYLTLVIIFMLIVSSSVLTYAFRLDRWISANVPYLKWVGDLPKELHMGLSNVALIVILLLAMLPMAVHWMRRGIELALDAVNHFAAPSRDFPVRTRTSRRLQDAIEFMLAPRDKPHLVVIAHSHGSAIAFDTLLGHYKFEYGGGWPFRTRKRVWVPGLWETRLGQEVESLTILTFGSPVTHLYQHYFSNLYPPLDEFPFATTTAPDRLSGRLRWFNCYRIDDFIGTYIDPSLPGFPVNIPMPIGGHTRYWSSDVFERLFAEPGMEGVLVDTVRG